MFKCLFLVCLVVFVGFYWFLHTGLQGSWCLTPADILREEGQKSITGHCCLLGFIFIVVILGFSCLFFKHAIEIKMT